MQHLTIKSLQIENVAGISSLSLNLKQENIITGANGSGKTTIGHAIAWLLTGKDLYGNTKWGIKPVDENNQPVHFINTCVKAFILINNQRFDVIKHMAETWEHKAGDTESTLTGHKYWYFVGGIEYSTKEFYEWLEDKLAPPEVIRTLLTPHAFNSLHWVQRRDTLMNFVNVPTDHAVAEQLDLGIEGDNLDAAVMHKHLSKNLKNLDSQLKDISARLSERSLDEHFTDFSGNRMSFLSTEKQSLLEARARTQQHIDNCERVLSEKARLIQDELCERFLPCKFKVFDKDEKPTCVTIVDGKEWSELSQGEKIKAGLSLCHQLQQAFEVQVPIIIDEHESAADTAEWQFPGVTAQTIRLYHVANKPLKIS